MRYALATDTLTAIQLRTVQDEVVRRALEPTIGVAEVRSCGGAEEHVEVTVDAKRLAARGLSLSDTASMPLAWPGAGPRTVEELGELPLNAQGVRLRDVASVSLGAAEPDCLALSTAGRWSRGASSRRRAPMRPRCCGPWGRSWRPWRCPPGVTLRVFEPVEALHAQVQWRGRAAPPG